MKQQIILFMIAGILFIPTSMYGSAKEQSMFCSTQTMESTDQIILDGKLENPGGFRSGGDPIIVEQQINALFIFFQKNVGLIQVTITGSQGLVYSTSVDTSAPSTLTVSLAGFPSGIYVINFNNGIGLMRGEIII
jgi:hypothetical protein